MALPQLVAATYSVKTEVVLAALQGIRKIVSVGHGFDEVIAAGVLPRVVELLRENGVTAVQFEAAWILGSVGSGTEHQTQCTVERGALPELVKLLQSPCEGLQDMAAWALGNIGGASGVVRSLVDEEVGAWQPPPPPRPPVQPRFNPPPVVWGWVVAPAALPAAGLRTEVPEQTELQPAAEEQDTQEREPDSFELALQAFFELAAAEEQETQVTWQAAAGSEMGGRRAPQAEQEYRGEESAKQLEREAQITGELQAKDQILREVQALQTATELKEQIASEIQAPDDAFFQAGRRERHYRKLARDWYRDVARDLDISEEDSMSDDTPLSCTTPPDQGDSDDLLYSEFPGFKDKKQDMKLDLGDEDNPGKGKGKSIADLTRPAGEWQFYELVDIPGKGKGKRRVSKAAAPLPAAATPPPAAAVPLPAAATPPPAAIAKYESDAESLATEIAQRAINVFNSRIQGMAGLPKVENLRHKLQDQRSALEKAEMGLMD